MRITNNIYLPKNYYNYYQSTQSEKNNQQNPIKNYKNYNSTVDYSKTAFGAMYNVKVKKVDIDAEKTKLLKQISEMLDIEVEDTDIEDIITNSVRKALQAFRTKLRKHAELIQKAEELEKDRNLSPLQKLERVNLLRKEAKRLEKPIKTTTKQNKPEKKPDEKIDYQLLNKFKTAISEDNFNLKKVIQNYYSGLNEISTISELNSRYPKIKIPKRPEQVIAEKIGTVLTRDFYEKIDKLYEKGSEEELQKLIINKIADLCNGLKLKYIDTEHFCKKIIEPSINTICQKYVIAKMSTGFSSLPENRKIKIPQITETDMKLLAVDFDNFVLSTIRKHYFEFQRLNDIKYESGDIKISMGELKSSDYKFEKMPEKIKSFANTSEKLFIAQKSYETYDTTQFKKRLNFFANSNLGNNEEILKRIIDFDACSFTKEDVNMLIKFLKELDNIHDGDKTLQEGIQTIQTEGYRPTGTEKLNEIELQKTAEIYKLQQQKNFQLNEIKNNFDNAINLLYENNLNNIANICSKYRPTSLDSKEMEDAKFIIEKITESIDTNTLNSINKAQLEASISRWDTFNYYKKNDSNNPIFKKAVRYTSNEDGSINIDKAGQYIINSEIVNSYPESLEFVREPEILTKIMDKTAGNTEAAIRYLSKFDDYKFLSENEKTYLSKILNIFDTKDIVDKTVLKHIIENDYIKSDTKVLTSIHDTSNETIPAEILSTAKQQIYNKYKYPTCIQYMSAFEDALSSFATATGTSGIKMTGKNNKTLEHKMELKIKGHDDRLFSSKNDYRFDIFSDRGMH